MRLLHIKDDGKLEFTADIVRSDEIPPYAILSHTWGEQEVVFDVLKNSVDTKAHDTYRGDGWNKIWFCAQQAKRDGLQYFWVDTCCIDKANNTELSEAINSMFRWYQNAEKCYVFLSDVDGKTSERNYDNRSLWKKAFRRSKWFSRGWTLQELLAPHSVEFFANDGEKLGNKESLKQTTHEVTKIPVEALSGSDLSEVGIAERFSWAQNRQTTRDEDGAYCLLGIFGCHLPLIYGEGKEKALKRLRKEMLEASEDIASHSMSGTKARSRIQEEKLSKICSWLSPPDPSTNHHQAYKQCQAASGLWLLESIKLKNWKENAASRLWLYGIPGCGKTVLSSIVIEHLQQHCCGGKGKVTVYFYFDFNDAQKQDPELMLRSLLCQLLQHTDTIPKGIGTLFSSRLNGRHPSLHELLNVLPQVMQQFTHVYVILDALDECTQRLELMDVLETMAGWQLDMVHLFITSRKERSIETSLMGYMEEDNTIYLQSDVVDEDILRYVQQRLRDDKHLNKWNKDSFVRQEIETALIRGARGMFRWAVCQLDTLAKCRNLAMLRKSLATLPQTLDQTYDRILNTISEQDSVYAMHILQWLTFSARPLRVEEIAEIVAIDVTREPVFERNEVLVDPLEVLDICSSLVTITMEEAEAGWIPAERLIALAHSSVREYLVSDRIKQGPAKRYSMQEVECHKAITKDCLGYLNQFQQPVARKLFKTSALARYSAEFWVDHLRKSGDDMGEAKHLATSLLSTKSPAFLSWIRLYDPDHPWREPDLARGLESLATPLYYGARLGSSAITKLLLDQGADINALDGAYSNALHAASHEGHEAVARLLLDHGADANVHIKECGSALQVAAARGHKAIVQLLINAGADINSRDGYFGNALQAASAQGYEEIVSIILDAGAYVDMQGGSHGSALRAAIAGSHETTVELLLARGASAGLDDRMKGPVHHAVDMVQCKPALVSLLQQYGAPLDTVDFDNMTPLHYCVKRSHKVISTQLLEVGVPVDSRVHRKAWSGRVGILGLEDTAQHPGFLALGLTPLHFAALTGNIMMTKVLLEHGADPNAPSDHGESPLHLALRSRLLGPDYKDDWNDECLKAQRLAVMSRFQVDAVVQHITSKREEVLDALLAAPEIQLNVKDVDGESPLHCIQYGKAEGPALVQKLVSRGADMNWRNSRHQTPLHLASKAGDHESVKILLSMGAKVAMTDKTGLNALHYAAGSGDRKTVIAILGTEDSKAAKLITSTDKNRQNVLHHLLSERPGSRVEMVQWLLDQGVDGSGLDNLGMSPLATYIKHSKGEISINICRTFLEIEGNASFEDRHGRTLGHMCAMRFDFGIHLLQLLSEHDVNLKRKDDQEKTILHHAAECGHLTEETLEFLVEFIEADDKDKRGRTALQLVINKIAEAHDPNGWNSNRWDRTRDVLMNHHNHHDHHEPFSALYSNSGRISRKRRLIGTR